MYKEESYVFSFMILSSRLLLLLSTRYGNVTSLEFFRLDLIRQIKVRSENCSHVWYEDLTIEK